MGRLHIGAILLLMLFCVVPISAQGHEAVVRPDPPVIEVAVGQTATVKFVLADAQNAYGIDVRATFDPQAVEGGCGPGRRRRPDDARRLSAT